MGHREATTDTVTRAAGPFLESGVSLDQLLERLVDTVVAELDADRGTLWLVDRAGGTLTSRVAHLPELPRISLAVGEGIAGWVAAEGELLNVEDPSADDRFDASWDGRTGYRTECILAVPVKDSRGEVVGVLQVLNARAGRFDAEAEVVAMELAAQAGNVLEWTSLHPSLKQSSPLGKRRREGLSSRFNQIVGASEAMERVYGLVDKAAGTDATVLIHGESGTGKELLARAVHVNSRRKDGPLVKVDCTTLPDALIENELFGHERGAFTGADRTVPGKFEVADGGTIFLDEIGELPLPLQAKLLRVLQDREFERVGGTKPIQTDVRVVCATHRDLVAMVDAGDFREDLYYRLRVVPIALPPLRDRGEEDLFRLVDHFVEKFSKRHDRPIERLTEAALDRIREHAFPGNIRELENCIESAVVLCEGGVIEASDLPLAARGQRRRRAEDAVPAGLRVGDPNVPLHDLERAHVRGVLEACEDNKSEAARRLGISRNALARKLSASPDPDDEA